MRPRPVQTRLPKAEATMKIYESEIVFSEAAVKLLQLDDSYPLVAFMYDSDAELAKRKRYYVAKATGAWPMKLPSVSKARRRVVRCRELSRNLAAGLDGYGTYRVCGEDAVNYNDMVWYNIFIRRYD